MFKSLGLAALILIISVVAAWAVVYFGRRAGESRSKLRMLAIGFVLAGLVFSVMTFLSEQKMRGTTLFEVMAEGSAGVLAGTEAPVRSYPFQVEHPGIEHSLLVVPRPDFGANAFGEVEIGVRLLRPDGTLLIDELRLFPTRREQNQDGFSRLVWDDVTWRFTPTEAAEYRLELVLITTDIPQIHVRIEDPEKRDGERIKGF